MKFFLALIQLVLLLCSQTFAATGDALDIQTRFTRYYANYSIREDGTAIESHEWAKVILKEAALEWSKSASVSYSTSAQKAEVVEAYTLKTDGTRINVPKDNYQVQVNSGRGKDSPVYSDWTTLTVVFPDVAVGDSVVFSYKITHIEPIFPGHFSTSQVFYSNVAHDDVRVRFDYPASLRVQYDAHGMPETDSGTRGDRKIVEWRYQNPRPLKTDRRDFSVLDTDKEVGFAFSTFKNYYEIANAYGTRALPKAAVTERIATLAEKITKNKPSKKEEARSLYEWVATNITYAGNCIGIGAVVPRDISFILDNKMGDCKDHATLLQSLLAARGIKSTQALVNSGSVYRLQKIPVVSNVNHVINFLPDFDLFVDSTSDSTPFGLLPFGDQDKPVLLVEGYKEEMKTPAETPEKNKQHSKVDIKIASDGALSGSVEVTLQGQSAVQSRAWARKITKDAEDDLVKNMLRGQNLAGNGKFEKDDPSQLTDVYRYKVSLSAERFMKMPGAGAFFVFPPLGVGGSILSTIGSATEPEKDVDVTCTGGTLVEDYAIELPKSLRILSMPENMKITNDLVSYTADYKLKGNVLKVKRTLVDRTKGNVCSPSVLAEYKKIADKAVENLKEQVLYK